MSLSVAAAALEREQGVGFWISSAHTRFATPDSAAAAADKERRALHIQNFALFKQSACLMCIEWLRCCYSWMEHVLNGLELFSQPLQRLPTNCLAHAGGPCPLLIT